MSILSVDQYKMIRELPVKSTIENGYDWVIIEGKDGTKRMKVEDFLRGFPLSDYHIKV